MSKGDLRKPFYSLTGDKLTYLVEQHLRLVLPNVKETMRLGDLDSQGIDVLHFEEDDGAVVTAIQVKGIEGQYKPEHTKKFIDEIGKFEKKAPRVKEYWLVINAAITDSVHRKRILGRLEALKESGHVEEALLLDIDPFVKKLLELATKKFRALAKRRRIEYRERYLASFDNVQYISDVPSEFADGEIVNPVAEMAKRVRASIDGWGPSCTGPGRRYPRFFLTGSFGFGKTLGLHAVGQLWHEMGDDSLFIPAVSLHENAFVHSAGLIDFLILELFSADDEFRSDHVAYKTLREACKSILAKEQWMLLIDAIDESSFWTDSARLRHLWYSIKELGLPAVVSVRSELVETRPDEFFGDKKIDFFERVDLTDWGTPQMVDFLDAFRDAQDDAPPKSFVRFFDLVQRGDYASKYGDIPKRPLFLQMLADDAWSGSDPEEQLFKLYGTYFRKKLQRDWERADTPSALVRGSQILIAFGRDEAQERLMQLMQRLALLAGGYDWDVQSEGAPFELNVTQLRITEAELKKCSAEVFDQAPILEQILFNSVIQPAGRDPLTRDRLFKFAHQSFFDWFVARAVVQWSLPITAPSKVIEDFMRSIRDEIAAVGHLP